MRPRQIGLALMIAVGLAGCAAPNLADYAAETPTLDLRTYLDGSLTASGVFFNRGGAAELRFVVDMEGDWQGDVGTLTERFRYSDGRTDERVWTLRFQDDHSFTATAADVVGTAEGAQRGNAATMRYSLRLLRDGDEIIVDLEDWFYLQEDGVLINRASMTKYGFEVGELFIAFRKTPVDP